MNIKVLLIDDEPYILDMLNAIIDWNKLNIECIGTCGNGPDGYEMITKHNPDLVVTDIRLPGYDGLELVKKCCENNIKVKFIIISGYKQFEYAQRAMNHGVKEFLLKPIKSAEINNALKRVSNEILNDREQAVEMDTLQKKAAILQDMQEHAYAEFIDSIENNSINISLDEINKNAHLHFKNELYRAVIFHVDLLTKESPDNTSFYDQFLNKFENSINEILNPLCHEYVSSRKKNYITLLINYTLSNETAIEKEILNVFSELRTFSIMFEHTKVSLSLSKPVSSFEEIKYAIQNVKECDRQRIMVSGSKPIKLNAVNNYSHLILVDDKTNLLIRNSIEKLDLNELSSIIKQSFDTIDISYPKDAMAYWAFEDQLVSKIILHMVSFGYESSESAMNNKHQLEMSLKSAGTSQLFREMILSYAQKNLASILEDPDLNEPYYVRVTKRYINEHFNEKLTLKSLANTVGLNSAYLSAFFKRATGETITDYLNEVRIKKAKYLLKHTSKMIYEISDEVGFKDTRWFTKVFKQYIGLSPNEYRNSPSKWI